MVEFWKFLGLFPFKIQRKEFFDLCKKLSARSFCRSKRFFHFKIACFSVLVKIVEIWNYLDLISFKIQHKDLFNEKIVSPLFLPLYIFLFDFAHRLYG